MDLVQLGESEFRAIPAPGDQELINSAVRLALDQVLEGARTLPGDQLAILCTYLVGAQTEGDKPILLRTTDPLEFFGELLEAAFLGESSETATNGLELATSLRKHHADAIAPIRQAAEKLTPQQFSQPSKQPSPVQWEHRRPYIRWR